MSADTNMCGLLPICRRLQDDAPEPRPADTATPLQQRYNHATTAAAPNSPEQRAPISLKMHAEVRRFWPYSSLEWPATLVARFWPKSSRGHGQTRRLDHGKVVTHWRQNASLADAGGPAAHHVQPRVKRIIEAAFEMTRSRSSCKSFLNGTEPNRLMKDHRLKSYLPPTRLFTCPIARIIVLTGGAGM